MAETERGRPTRPARDPVPDPDPDPAAALIAVGLIGLVRGLPNKAETEAAEGGALSG